MWFLKSEFDVRVTGIEVLEEGIQTVLGPCPNEKAVIYVPFPKERLCGVGKYSHVGIGVAGSNFGTHACAHYS